MIKLLDYKRQANIYKQKIVKNIEKNIAKGDFILGNNVRILESKIKNKIKSKYCVTCSSGTDALIMSLLSLEIKPNDIILTTVYSYISTAEVIKLLGAIPVFVDVDKNTFNIDSNNLEITIENLKKKKFENNAYPVQLKNISNINLKAIIAVSLFGNIYDYKKINKIAKKYNIIVIEDAAQSFGAKNLNKYSGNISDIGCFSFYPTKSLGCYGDGGAITTNNKKIYKKLLSIRVHGQYKTGLFDKIGITGRLDTIQASVLLEKLKKFDNEMKNRNKIAKIYNKSFSKTKEIFPQIIFKNYTSAYTVYTICFKNNKIRNFICSELENKKIDYGIYYKKPFHMQKVFSEYKIKNRSFPVANNLSKTTISLPIDPYLKLEELKKVIYTVKNGIKKFYS